MQRRTTVVSGVEESDGERTKFVFVQVAEGDAVTTILALRRESISTDFVRATRLVEIIALCDAETARRVIPSDVELVDLREVA